MELDTITVKYYSNAAGQLRFKVVKGGIGSDRASILIQSKLDVETEVFFQLAYKKEN